MRFPGEDGRRSLAEMAQRDLDAALQLLADRAQYITGASGAAIALRRDGRDDMLCRASVGSNAPELGALLSTEFGLSGESVRTRQLLRCDDAERDARVNREVCRQMGIASVLVMPVVNDDQVLGVFELFSGKANAFGERDLSAVQRLSEMVETAVRLAHAAETLPEQLRERESSVAEAIHPEVFEGQFLGDLVVEEAKPPRLDHSPHESIETFAAAALESPASEQSAPAQITPKRTPAEPQAMRPDPASYSAPAAPAGAKTPLFWSAADAGEGDLSQRDDGDQSHIPPVLRGLRKCEACGFPISAGRTLCVECEEKKWRGQLRPQAPDRGPKPGTGSVSASRSVGGAAAAPSMAKIQAKPSGPSSLAANVPVVASVSVIPVEDSQPTQTLAASEAEASPRTAGNQDLVLSAGLAPSRSWFADNKYIVLGLLAIGLTVAGFLLLR